MLDEIVCRAAVGRRDARFDGHFLVAEPDTGLYCRPSCSTLRPDRRQLHFYPSTAASQQAGFRACNRCRPGGAPGSPEWNSRDDLVGRAMRLIADGFIEREGAVALAARLGCSPHRLDRHLAAELGATSAALIRAQRAESARILLEGTSMPLSEVAFAAGFVSPRELDDTVRAIFGAPSADLRQSTPVEDTKRPRVELCLRLAYRAPLEVGALFGFLHERAIPGVEAFDGTSYRRVLTLPHGIAVVSLRAGREGSDSSIAAHLELIDARDLPVAIGRCRRLLDLDADPVIVVKALSRDPLLASLASTRPGLRVAGTVDPTELALRAILGQQVSVAGARTIGGRLAAAYGHAVPLSRGDLTTAFPSAETLAALDPGELPLPATRAKALIHLAEAVASGALALDPGVDREETERALLALPGIGPWTAAYIRMRALSDPDALLVGDLGLRHALEALGERANSTDVLRRAEAWRPWRAYALHHLWASLPRAISSRPNRTA